MTLGASRPARGAGRYVDLPAGYSGSGVSHHALTAHSLARFWCVQVRPSCDVCV